MEMSSVLICTLAKFKQHKSEFCVHTFFVLLKDKLKFDILSKPVVLSKQFVLDRNSIVRTVGWQMLVCQFVVNQIAGKGAEYFF